MIKRFVHKLLRKVLPKQKITRLKEIRNLSESNIIDKRTNFIMSNRMLLDIK